MPLYLHGQLNDGGELFLDNANIMISLPTVLAYGILCGQVLDLCIVSPFAEGKFECHPKVTCNIDRSFASKFSDCGKGDQIAPFSLLDASSLADDLRIASGKNDAAVHNRLRLQQWVTSLQLCSDLGVDPNAYLGCMRSKARQAEQWICLIIIANMLRNVSNFQDVVLEAVKFALPADVYAQVEPYIGESLVLGTSKGEISRARLHVDVGLMLFWRVVHWLMHTIDSYKCVYYMSWDSSPQFGKDYEMVYLQFIYKSSLCELYRIYLKLRFMWDDEINDIPWISAKSRLN